MKGEGVQSARKNEDDQTEQRKLAPDGEDHYATGDQREGGTKEKQENKTGSTDDSESEEMRKENTEKTLKIIEMERTHLQWAKQGINFFIFLILVFINLYRGSKKNPSMFGIERCSGADWSSLVVFVILCSSISWYSVRRLQYE
jgi:uncharacterized membrane protein YfcA